MRFFAVEGGERTLGVEPLRIVREYVGEGNLDDPTGHRDDLEDVTEQELLALEGGRRALKLWRAGDDTAHANSIRAELEAAVFDDELVHAGLEARPDLRERLHEANGAWGSDEEIDHVMNEIRRAGAETLGQDRA